MVRLGAHLLLRTDAELALYGRYVYYQRLRECGLAFNPLRLDEALATLAGE